MYVVLLVFQGCFFLFCDNPHHPKYDSFVPSHGIREGVSLHQALLQQQTGSFCKFYIIGGSICEVP